MITEYVRARPNGEVHRVTIAKRTGLVVHEEPLVRDPWRDPYQALGGRTGRDRDSPRKGR